MAKLNDGCHILGKSNPTPQKNGDYLLFNHNLISEINTPRV